MIISCLHCKADTGVEEPQRLSDNTTGFLPFMNTMDGLTLSYLCPPCAEIAFEHCRGLIKLFGDAAPHISYRTVIYRLMPVKRPDRKPNVPSKGPSEIEPGVHDPDCLDCDAYIDEHREG